MSRDQDRWNEPRAMASASQEAFITSVVRHLKSMEFLLKVSIIHFA